MCLIICRSQKNINSYLLDETRILNAIEQNNDGVGIMYKKDNRVQVFKSLETDPEKVLQMLKEHLKVADRLSVDFLAHLRFKTHGAIDEANLHPFRIDTTRRGGPIFMMHNGVIQSADRWDRDLEEQGRSDTYHYAKYVMGGLLSRNPHLIRNHEFRSLIARDLGRTNRLAFMDKSGEAFIVAADGGHSEGGLWFSNDSYFDAWSRYYGGYGNHSAAASSNKTVPTVATNTSVQKGGGMGKPSTSKPTKGEKPQGTNSKPAMGQSSATVTSVSKKTGTGSKEPVKTVTSVAESTEKESQYERFCRMVDEIDSAASTLSQKLVDMPREAVYMYLDMTTEVQNSLQDFYPVLVEDIEDYYHHFLSPEERAKLEKNQKTA